jgi:hypothetical protein
VATVIGLKRIVMVSGTTGIVVANNVNNVLPKMLIKYNFDLIYKV